jgi:hypothetical protein
MQIERQLAIKLAAKALERSEVYISRLVRKGKCPNEHMAREISRIVGVPIEQLLYGENWLKKYAVNDSRLAVAAAEKRKRCL